MFNLSVKYFFILSLLFAFQLVSAQDKFLTIGSGGGFTGSSTVFKISSNGQVLKGKGLAEVKFSEEGRIKTRKAKKYFKAVTIQISTVQYNKPGNVFYFIGVDEKRITWGDNASDAPKEAEKLYQEIMSILNSIQYSKVSN